MAKHKCKIPDPPPDTGRWMGTYGDMVTLLMAFFVMLFAVSETNNQKFEAFVAGLAGPFDNPAVELGLVDGAALEDGSSSPISLIAPVPSAPQQTVQASQEIVDEVEESEAAQEQLAEIEEQLEQVLAETTVPISADLRDDERGLVVSISTDDVLFPVGSAEIAEVGEQLIAEIAPVLINAPNTVVIEGHTDNQPLTTRGYSNWNLSTDRAVAVLELLGGSYGMPFDRISATGYGEHRPLVPNDSPANQSINRRVEILIVGLHIASGGAPPPPSGAITSGDVAPAPPTADAPSDEVVLDPAEPADPAVAEGGPGAGGDAIVSPLAEDLAAGGPARPGGPTLATILGQ